MPGGVSEYLGVAPMQPPLPPPVADEWMARQVIAYHKKGDRVCAGCNNHGPCTRLAQARAFMKDLEDGSPTDTSVTRPSGSTVRHSTTEARKQGGPGAAIEAPAGPLIAPGGDPL